MSFLLRLPFDNLPTSKHNPVMSNATTNRAVIVAERTTADGFNVNVYSDGAIVGAGAVILAPKLPARCLWQAVQSICSWDRAELPALVSHARKLAARKAEPEAGDFIRGFAMTPPPAPKTKVICDHWMQDGQFRHRDRRVPVGYR